MSVDDNFVHIDRAADGQNFNWTPQPAPPPLQPQPPPLLLELPAAPPLESPAPPAPPPLAPAPLKPPMRAGKERASEQYPPCLDADGDSSDDDELIRAVAASRLDSSVGAGDGAAEVTTSSSAGADPTGAESSVDNLQPELELPEQAGFNLDPDELDFDEEDMFGLNDAQLELQQRLGETLHNAGAEELEELEELAEDATRGATATGAAEDVEALAAASRAWAWDSPLEQRWAEAVSFLRGAAGVVVELRGLAQPHLEEARRGRAEASAGAFKKARLIAATVVGGVRRLEPLRAAEPFAAVVEEACEVMEPTLMAVLSMRSLCKLELVGDHRQLPAQIPHAWYNLEGAIPSMKISLFERLVKGAAGRGTRAHGALEGGVAPCTVLDEQRRMRPAISDLTRGHYSDLVKIQDHACTVAQRIGDRCTGSAMRTLKLERAAWAGGGELVPGVAAQEFFWDLPNNAEGRPTAGAPADEP
jgi:hypothetical protein